MSSITAARPAGSADSANEPREVLSAWARDNFHIVATPAATQARRQAEKAFAKITCRKVEVVRIKRRPRP